MGTGSESPGGQLSVPRCRRQGVVQDGMAWFEGQGNVALLANRRETRRAVGKLLKG